MANSVTSTSLLLRVRANDASSWQQLCTIYGPTVYGWARRSGLQDCDAADVVQDVFQSVSQSIGGFRRESDRDSFQAWLRTITRNKVLDHFRKRREQAIGGSNGDLQLQAAPAHQAPDFDSMCAPDDQTQIKLRTLQLLKHEFAETVWQSFWRVAVLGDLPRDVAEDLGVSPWAVYKAKARVLQRLRQELAD